MTAIPTPGTNSDAQFTDDGLVAGILLGSRKTFSAFAYDLHSATPMVIDLEATASWVTPFDSSVNGVWTRGNNYQIDGADNNDAFHNVAAVNQGGVSGIAGTLLPIDAIDQFSVQSGGGAELGRNSGSTVNLVIKSGTNQVHGSAYYCNRHEALAAQSPIVAPGSPKREIRNNQGGFSLGGPIVKNKSFFFTTFESQKLTAGNTTATTYTRTNDLRSISFPDGSFFSTFSPTSAVVLLTNPFGITRMELDRAGNTVREVDPRGTERPDEGVRSIRHDGRDERALERHG